MVYHCMNIKASLLLYDLEDDYSKLLKPITYFNWLITRHQYFINITTFANAFNISYVIVKWLIHNQSVYVMLTLLMMAKLGRHSY